MKEFSPWMFILCLTLTINSCTQSADQREIIKELRDINREIKYGYNK